MAGFFGLSEPSGGSNPARAIQARGVRDGDDWVINGRKLWNSRADTSDYGVVFVRTDPSKGRDGISAFIIPTDTPGFRIERLVQVLRSHHTTELSFTDMRIPHENIVGEEGGGFRLANEQLTRNRIPYTSACLGVGVYAHELAVDWAKQRETFGQPLANRQATTRSSCAPGAGRPSRRPTRPTAATPAASRRRWPSSSARRTPAAWSTAACRSSAASG